MGLMQSLLDGFVASPILVLFTVPIALLGSRCMYRLLFHPLSHIPGPFLARLTHLWLYYHAYIGDEATVINASHVRYGPLVRVSPSEVDIGDADAIAPIYVIKGGFPKAPCYANFDIDGHKTIFSTTDPEHRAPRAKAVVPMFSTKSIKSNEDVLYGCIDRMVERIKNEASTGRPVNLLNITRSLAVDIVSTHLFEQNYNATSERGSRLSVSAFVDAFVAVGRFFYLPTSVFPWVEWATEKFSPDEQTNVSMDLVEDFVDGLVRSTPQDSQNYPGRLLTLGLEISEVKSQCKDLIFAGTDSTGMNLATIFRCLAVHPKKYKILHEEIMANSRAGSQRQEIQSLPYLSAVVKEGLRISMANPTRLPHIVPAGGWNFKSTQFPAGALVGCSAYELHLNREVFPCPFEFMPERWLGGDTTTEANKYWFAFGAGTRACIARNLATTELYMGTERVVESDVLRGARPCQERVEIFEWFNSSVKGEKIDLIWENP